MERMDMFSSSFITSTIHLFFDTYFSVGLIRKLFTSQIINEQGDANIQNAKDGFFSKTKHLRKALLTISQDSVC